MANLAQMLTDTAAEHGDRPAIKLDDLVLRLRRARGRQPSRRRALRARGVEPGDRVGLMLPNVPHFPFLFFGALRLGAVVVPMNPLLKEREVGFHLSDSGAKLLFAWHQFGAAAQAGAEQAGAECVLVEPGKFEQEVGAAEPVAEIAEREDEDTALILYTSGTTGTPKGAELTHGNLRAAAQISVDLVDSGPDTVTFGGLPLFHVFGLTSGLNSCVRVGGELTLLPRFDPAKALEIVQRDGSTRSSACRRCTPRCCTTPSATPSTPPAWSCASRAAPRCRWRCCAASRRRSAARCSRATGSPSRARSPRSTARTASASPGRSGSR